MILFTDNLVCKLIILAFVLHVHEHQLVQSLCMHIMSELTPTSSTSTKRDSMNIEGVKLTPREWLDADIKQCIICQKHDKVHNVISTYNGRQKLKRAAEVRQDDVYKRLKHIGDDDYVYHVNKCYKSYTLQKSLDAIIAKAPVEHHEAMDVVDESDSCQRSVSLRSESVPRSEPSTSIHPDLLPCVVCGNVSIKVKGTQQRTTFRICERKRAQLFLDAIKHNRDAVFDRVSDVTSVENVFAADLYCHTSCIKKYILNYQRSLGNSNGDSQDKDSSGIEKNLIFEEVVKQIDVLLEREYCFSVSEVREIMESYNEYTGELTIRNRDVKHLLIQHYGDSIQFAQNPRRNESELVFSAKIEPGDLACKIKNLDVLKEAGTLLRTLLKDVDFGLTDKFCDAEQLKESWEKTQMPDGLLTFFSALFEIPKADMSQIEAIIEEAQADDSNEENCDDTENDSNDENSHKAFKTHTALHCLFQMMTYQIHKGHQKTPMHAMVGQSVYAKTRSKVLLTLLQHLGMSTGYSEVRRSRKLLSSYAVHASGVDETPIPSHFNKSDFCIGAMDNSDYADNSSLSGMHSKHYTAMVMFQEAVNAPVSKPSVSSTGLSKSAKTLCQKLPCQIVPNHPKPVVRPSLPPDFPLRENMELGLCDPEEAAKNADDIEFVLSLVRSGLQHSPMAAGELPTWGGIHALVSRVKLTLMRVGFLPMIPEPVTNYGTVHKALCNFQSVRKQLSQDVIPVFSDQGVFQIITDLVMSYPDKFVDIYPMMGMFHYAKVLLRCGGRLLLASGLDDGLIEAEVFGKKIVQSVLAGSHYVRAFKGMLIIEEVLTLLKWRSFLDSHADEVETPFIEEAVEVKIKLAQNKKTDLGEQFHTLVSHSDTLHKKFDQFIEECEAKSEVCQYLGQFKHIVDVIKHMIAADREGNWPLHIASVRESMKILRAFDCINYLRYASWYLERIEVLEVEQPILFRRFMMGQFVVQDREGGKFTAVSPDMKLEQTINRSEKGPGGHVIVGCSGDATVVAEFELLFHEITGITNLFKSLTHAGIMSHLDATAVHHELRGGKALLFDNNVRRLFDFLLARQNPFSVTAVHVPLHNLVTNEIVASKIAARLLTALESGEKVYQEYRKERFVQKRVKLSGTISKMSLPYFNTQSCMDTKSAAKPIKATITAKHVANAVHDVDIAKERGKPLDFILSHDLFEGSPLFEEVLNVQRCTKPNKSQIIAELENHLGKDDYNFHPVSDLKTHTLLDFMSKTRQYGQLSRFDNIGQVLTNVIVHATDVCASEYSHLLFYSYFELSLKGGERSRRAESAGGSIEVVNMSEMLPIPQQMEKFWASTKNKQNIQLLARDIAMRDFSRIVLSGMVVDEEVIPAKVQEHPGADIDEPSLSSWQEEADTRLVSHINWSVDKGCERVLVLSNDTDSSMNMLRYLDMFFTKGLKELWVEFGTGENRRKIPLHKLLSILGAPLCRNLIKVHILSGDDCVSKVGTKHAALVCNPLVLVNFAETDSLTAADMSIVEDFLVKVWSGSRSKPTADTFDKLRHDHYLKGKPLNELPPTSAVIRGHIRRCFYLIRNVVTLLETRQTGLDPEDFGWTTTNGVLCPTTFMHRLSPELLVVCSCSGKCDTRRCKCKASDVRCVLFCHKDKVADGICLNH